MTMLYIQYFHPHRITGFLEILNYKCKNGSRNKAKAHAKRILTVNPTHRALQAEANVNSKTEVLGWEHEDVGAFEITFRTQSNFFMDRISVTTSHPLPSPFRLLKPISYVQISAKSKNGFAAAARLRRSPHQDGYAVLQTGLHLTKRRRRRLCSQLSAAQYYG
jgi:hypothetical protein